MKKLTFFFGCILCSICSFYPMEKKRDSKLYQDIKLYYEGCKKKPELLRSCFLTLATENDLDGVKYFLQQKEVDTEMRKAPFFEGPSPSEDIVRLLISFGVIPVRMEKIPVEHKLKYSIIKGNILVEKWSDFFPITNGSGKMIRLLSSPDFMTDRAQVKALLEDFVKEYKESMDLDEKDTIFVLACFGLHYSLNIKSESAFRQFYAFVASNYFLLARFKETLDATEANIFKDYEKKE